MGSLQPLLGRALCGRAVLSLLRIRPIVRPENQARSRAWRRRRGACTPARRPGALPGTCWAARPTCRWASASAPPPGGPQQGAGHKCCAPRAHAARPGTLDLRPCLPQAQLRLAPAAQARRARSHSRRQVSSAGRCLCQPWPCQLACAQPVEPLAGDGAHSHAASAHRAAQRE